MPMATAEQVSRVTSSQLVSLVVAYTSEIVQSVVLGGRPQLPGDPVRAAQCEETAVDLMCQIIEIARENGL